MARRFFSLDMGETKKIEVNAVCRGKPYRVWFQLGSGASRNDAWMIRWLIYSCCVARGLMSVRLLCLEYGQIRSLFIIG